MSSIGIASYYPEYQKGVTIYAWVSNKLFNQQYADTVEENGQLN